MRYNKKHEHGVCDVSVESNSWDIGLERNYVISTWTIRIRLIYWLKKKLVIINKWTTILFAGAGKDYIHVLCERMSSAIWTTIGQHYADWHILSPRWYFSMAATPFWAAIIYRVTVSRKRKPIFFSIFNILNTIWIFFRYTLYSGRPTRIAHARGSD